MTELQELISGLKKKSDLKIVMLIIDGLGGLQNKDGHTELETASTPNLDRLAAEGACGLVVPIAPGITPGSGPAHLALFGYDPVEHDIKRGVLAAFGIGFPMKPGDLAARANFATFDTDGKVIDRRAGRISTEENKRLCEVLDGIKIDGVECFVKPVKEHRALVVFRGEGLSDALSDTDPQETGVSPLRPVPLEERAGNASRVVSLFLEEVSDALSGEKEANGMLLRGFSGYRTFPSMNELYGLRPLGIASYPMYRGLARLVGMDLVEPYADLKEAALQLYDNWDSYDFFFFHYKYADSRGEDGDFGAKVSAIEEIDAAVPMLGADEKTLFVVTGDHSTPSSLASHSWHPVPILIHGRHVRRDGVTTFGEETCRMGSLGIFRSREIISLAMAGALKLEKFGA